MKVLAINGSPHKSGNTAYAIDIVASELKTAGIDIEVINIGKEVIGGCTACGGCSKHKDERCTIKGDNVNEYIQKMKLADGIILASPVHFASMSGAMKSFLDRSFYVSSANGGLFRHKVATAVVAVRRGGGMTTFDQLMNYLLYAEMIIPTSNYWNVIHGRLAGDAVKDEEGNQIMRVLGKNMAWILKLIEHGRDTIKPPEQEQKIMTSFVR